MENWKNIENTNHHISDHGRFKKIVNDKMIYICGWADKYNYKIVSYYINNVRKREFVHRLVAQNFVNKTDNTFDVVNHIDSNKINNHYTNLEWTNAKGNRIHAVNELNVGTFQRKVNQYNLNGKLLHTFNSIKEAVEYNNTLNTAISKVVRGELKTHKNFIFKYADNRNNDVDILPDEIWKKITNYEKLYQVSNMGRVKSTQNKNHIILKQHDKGDYQYVYLRKNNEQLNCRVHRLVAMEFIPNPNCLSDVHHIDHNKKNNKLTNLEWLSHTDNCNK